MSQVLRLLLVVRLPMSPNLSSEDEAINKLKLESYDDGLHAI